jgi:hypothetical protein
MIGQPGNPVKHIWSISGQMNSTRGRDVVFGTSM